MLLAGAAPQSIASERPQFKRLRGGRVEEDAGHRTLGTDRGTPLPLRVKTLRQHQLDTVVSRTYTLKSRKDGISVSHARVMIGSPTDQVGETGCADPNSYTHAGNRDPAIQDSQRGQ